jgi:hypothetical protein
VTQYVLVFNDDTEIQVGRDDDGTLLVRAKIADRAINEFGFLAAFGRPAPPGEIHVVLAGMAVDMVRLITKAHGGIYKPWTDKRAIELLREVAAAEPPSPPTDDIPPDPPYLAEVLRRPREAAPKAAPFRGASAAVPAGHELHDGAGLRPLATDTVMACLEEARARFTEEVVRPIEPPADPVYAKHWSPARGWRAKVSALRIISEVLDAALEPEFAGHPRQGDVQALRARIAELSVTWRTKALNAEGNRRVA